MHIIKSLVTASLLSLLLAGAAFAQEKVNINTADAATLDRVLVNIGPSKAEAIVAYRKENGAFKSIEQLALVKGVGLKTVEKNREHIEIGTTPPRKPNASGKVANQAPAKPVAKPTVANR